MMRAGIATLFVSDLDRAFAFYTKTLGLAPGMHVPGKWAQVSAGDGFQIGLHPSSDESPAGATGSMSIGFYADRPIDQAVADLKKAGVRFDGAVVDDGPVRLASFTDPDGNPLYLAEYAGAPARP
ncbi:MAG: VOC family protein [Phycisphaerales bacterium]